LYSPTNNAIGQDVNVLLDWTTVYGITKYIYQVDTTTNFNSPLLISNTISNASSAVYMSELKFGTKYYWRVKSAHTNDTTQWSSVWNFTTTDFTYLYSPTNNAIGQDVNVLLDWTTVYGITKYIYQVDTTTNFNSPLLISNTITNSSSGVYMSELKFGTKYYWRVKSAHTNDTTQWSSVWNFTTTDYVSLYSPTNNAVGVSINPTLDWYTTNGVTNYIYQIDDDPDMSDAATYTISNSSSQTTIALEYGENYYWRVKAYHSNDTTQWSNTWKFTTIYQLATAPTLISPANNLSNIIGTIDFSWTSSPGATLYEIQFDTENSFINPTSNLVTEIAVTLWDFEFGTTYYWRVRGTNLSGNSPWSVIWNFSMQSIIPPTLISPTNNAINQNYSLSLDWSDVTNITEYVYQYSTDNSFSTFIEGNTTSSNLNINNLEMNTQYFWHIKSNIQGNISNWSETWNFTTKNILPPVLIFPANNSTNQFTSINFDWNDVTGATKYGIEIGIDENFSSSFGYEPTTSSQLVNFLNYNQQYFWRIKTFIDTYSSDWSQVWNFTTKSLPIAPVLISPSFESINQNISLTLDWSTVSNIQSYELQYSEIETFYNYVSSVVYSSQATINNLNNFTQYYWKVRTYDGSEYSDWSEIWTFTTKLETPVLLSPSNNSVNVVFENLQLVCNNVENATDYQFVYSTDENLLTNVVTFNTVNPQIIISQLQDFTQYFWKVRAFYDDNESNWSDVWNFQTKAILDIPYGENTDFLIYPNPCSEYIFINTNTNIDLIEIFDISGKMVLYSNSVNNKILDVKNFISGIYFVRIYHENLCITLNFIKD
jgi:hypothetical protein